MDLARGGGAKVSKKRVVSINKKTLLTLLVTNMIILCDMKCP